MGAKTVPDRDSAPGLPPSPSGPRPRVLDNDKGEEFASRTLAGHEPAKAATSARMKADSSGARALATEPSALPAAPKRPSSAPIILGILLVVAGAIAAIYFLFLKQDTQTATPDKGTATVKPDKGSAGSANVGTNTGSAGSATTAMGSNAGSAEQGSANTGSATTMAAGSAAAHPVDTIIAAGSTKGATVTIEGTDMTGPAPFTAKLEKDKDYKAHVTAPGFVAQEIDVKGGQKEITAKLVAKPKEISVTSTPAGADIAIDGALTGKQTPADITLTAAQAARAKFHVTLRHAGYRPLDQIVDASTFTEDDAKLTATINATLTIAPKVVPNTNTGTTTNNNNAGSGATTPTGTGSGSAATTPTGTGTTGSGTGSAASGTSGGTTTPPAGGTTTPPAGGTTTPPAGGSTTTTPAAAPSGGTAGSASSGGQVLK